MSLHHYHLSPITSATVFAFASLGAPAAWTQDTPSGMSASTIQAAAEEEQQLPMVTVTDAVYPEGVGAIKGYHASRGSTATRTDLALIDTPVAVQTVSQALISDQSAKKLGEVLSHVSGVYLGHCTDGNTMDCFMLRGFEAGVDSASYADGVKDFSRSPKEMAGLERVDVLKGPAAIMYGRIEPGGMVNRISKRPQATPLTKLEQEFGSYRHLRTSLDSTGKLRDDASLLYRVNWVAEDQNGFKVDTHNRHFYLAPQIEWRPSAATSVRLGLESFKDKRSWALTYGTIGDAKGPINFPIRTNLHGKDDHYREASNTLKLDWSHRFTDNWQLRQRASYSQRKGVVRGTYLTAADEEGYYQRKYWGKDDEQTRLGSTNIELQGQFTTGPARHTVVLGGDYFHEDYTSGGMYFGGTPVRSHILAPVYTDHYRLDANRYDYGYRNRNLGAFVQDQMAFFDDRLHVLLGARYDKAQHFMEYDRQPKIAHDSKATWRAGVLYKLLPTLSTYASYVTGFGTSQFNWKTGQAFPPQTSQQWEAGVKYEITPDLGVTVAAFQLVKDNMTMADPINPLNTILAGKARSRGIEIDATGRIGRSLDVIASYNYTDARYTKSDTLQGERAACVPRHGASLWGNYRLGNTGWRLGAGVIYRSSILGTQRAWEPELYPYTLRGYTLVNAMASYDFTLFGQAARAQFNVQNVANKRYYPASFSGSDRFSLGEPRKVTVSLSVTF